MTSIERNAVIEECAKAAEQTLDGSHEGNVRAELIAETIRLMKTVDIASAGRGHA